KGERKIYLPRKKRFSDVDVFDALALKFGNRIRGPAILEQVNTTTFVAPEFDVLVDRWGSYTLYLKEKAGEIEKRILGKSVSKSKGKGKGKAREPKKRPPTKKKGSIKKKTWKKKKAPSKKRVGAKKKAGAKKGGGRN
ncbi:MAG: hypothetical protein ACYTFG_22285, partial [Planctomycetota bacterium]